MRAEGVEFRVNAHVGATGKNGVSAARPARRIRRAGRSRRAPSIRATCDVPGRDLDGVHFAMDFLPLQNRRVAGDADVPPLTAKGKHVIVIGGGDTGSDCVGTSNRQGALSVTQFELLPQPPEHENKPLVWPYWPMKMRTSSSHEEGCERDWAVADQGVQGRGRQGAMRSSPAASNGRTAKLREVPGSEFELKADLVLLAMGYLHPVHAGMLDELGVEYDARGNVKADTEHYRTSVAEGLRRRRHAPRPVAGRLGDTRGPPVRARRRRIPDGRVRAAALVHRFANDRYRRARRRELAAGAQLRCAADVAIRTLEGGGVLVLAAACVSRSPPTSSASCRRAGPTAARRTSASTAASSRARAARADELAALSRDGCPIRGRGGGPGHDAVSALCAVRSAARAPASGRSPRSAARSRGARTTRACTSTHFRRGRIMASASCACSATSIRARIACGASARPSKRWRAGFCRAFAGRSPARRDALSALHVTKGLRSPYDHLMLGLHDGAKADLAYQRELRAAGRALRAGHDVAVLFRPGDARGGVGPVHARADDPSAARRAVRAASARRWRSSSGFAAASSRPADAASRRCRIVGGELRTRSRSAAIRPTIAAVPPD